MPKTETILFVDDSPASLRCCEHFCLTSGYGFLGAGCKESALEKLDSHSEITGVFFDRRVSRDLMWVSNSCRGLPVVLIIHEDPSDELVADMRSAGIFGCVRKPIDREKFLKIAEKMFRTEERKSS